MSRQPQLGTATTCEQPPDQLQLGRDFAASDTLAGAESVVIVSYGFWRSRLGGDSHALGTFLTQLEGRDDRPVSTRIVGVLPSDFRFEYDDVAWFPTRAMFLRASRGDRAKAPRTGVVFGRLKPGITLERANAELATVERGLEAEYPDSYRGWETRVDPLRAFLTRRASVAGRVVLFAIAMLVLLVAITNVAGLFLARAAARERELAVHRALGASRWRLVRPWMTESIGLGLIAGVMGALIAVGGVRASGHWLGGGAAGLAPHVDARVLAFTILVSLLAGAASGLLPAWQASRVNFADRLREHVSTGSRGLAGWVPHALVVVQIGCGLMLLTGAGLLSKEFLQLQYADTGLDPRKLSTVFVLLPRGQHADAAQIRLLGARVRERIAGIPGVVSANLAQADGGSRLVMAGDEPTSSFRAGQSRVWITFATFFHAMRTPIRVGRAFTPDDGFGAAAVAIVNENAAARFWPGQSPLGRSLLLQRAGAGAPDHVTVVGVAANAKLGGSYLATPRQAVIYRPFEQAPPDELVTVYIRTAGSGARIWPAVYAAIREITGRAALPAESVEQANSDALMSQRFNAAALDLFATFAVLLAAMGIYGLVAFAVARRTREIGIRVALGAPRGGLMALFAGRTVLLATGGVALGILGSLAATRVLRSFVVLTSVTDRGIFAAAAALLFVVALLATCLPARRALCVDPLSALGSE